MTRQLGRSANGVKGYWSFAAGHAVDWSGHGNGLALKGGAECSTNCGDGVLQLNGSDGYASSAWPVLQTDSSFTVMAWVKMSELAGFHTALSQDGNRVSGFFLQYSAKDDRWAFSMTSADSPESITTRALSVVRPVLNKWVHLGGVHDAAEGQIQLYVNCSLDDTRIYEDAWSASKAFQVGRAQWEGAPVDFFPGAITEVRAFERVLTAAEIAAAADLTQDLRASYAMDEGGGETADDHVSGHSLTLDNVRWGGGFSGAGLEFDGGEAAATVPRFLDTNTSFSISAWLRLRDMNGWRTAVSQDGTTVSGFFLQYSHDDQTWAFSMLDSDSIDATPTRALATRPPRIGEWQHLVGVHDADRGQLRLYVDGQRAGTAVFRGGWCASGEFVVGRALFESRTDWFVGNIDQIRAWKRALTDTDVSILV